MPQGEAMTRRQKEPLRPLTAEERAALEQLSRASSEPASHVARARLVLAVAAGQSYTAAARGVGRRSGDAVAQLVARFNQEGLAALAPRHGGGAAVVYGEAARARILAEVRRTPDRDADRTATWSLSTLCRALRAAPDGLPGVSEYTIWCVLRGAGRQWQRSRSWCETGVVVRKRKAGPVVVVDPDAAPKKS
jgi:transposase